MPILLDNVDDNATSDEVKLEGGLGILFIRGDDFGGGTVEIQIKSANDPGGRWATIDNGSFTENATKIFGGLFPQQIIKAVFSGATSPSNVFVELQ